MALYENASFPVGKVNLMTMYPMTFTEFLKAMGKDGLASLLRDGKYENINDLYEEYNNLLKQYLTSDGIYKKYKRL